MNHITKIQAWLVSHGLAGVILPSADEFLSEFPPPSDRRLLWATGFRGSTGLSIVARDSAALFLDGRYLSQGVAETAEAPLTTLPANASSRHSWLKRTFRAEDVLGIDPRLHSETELIQWRESALAIGFKISLLAANPVDELWGADRPRRFAPGIVDHPTEYSGDDHLTKRAALVAHLADANLQGLFVPDPDDVSWLLNVRSDQAVFALQKGDWPVTPVARSRAFLARDGVLTWFVEAALISESIGTRKDSSLRIESPERLNDFLIDAAKRGRIGANLRRIPASLAATIQRHGCLVGDDSVARRRWRKHPSEIAAAKCIHVIDAVAIVRFMAWLEEVLPGRAVTELEAADRLASLRAQHSDYRGPSMPVMAASGASGAWPHYVPAHRAGQNSGGRVLNDHPIFWLDSGGQYQGGTTDNTITMALGVPTSEHRRAHTRVLQGLISLTTTIFPEGVSGLALDAFARRALWQEGMDYAHATGHGVGSYLNIHEGPVVSQQISPLSNTALEAGMIIANEPAYYAEHSFGVRLETHMLVTQSPHAGYLQFETISRLPIDPRLVDFSLLSANERIWLRDYHRAVLDDLGPCLETPVASWLEEFMRPFNA